MKKTFLAALTGVVVLAGCAKTEVTEVSDNRAISFSNFVTNSVKSIDETGDLNKFYVYGGFEGSWNLFENQLVELSGSDWKYSPVKFWVENVQYYYAAYSNDNGNDGVTNQKFDGGNTNELSFDYSITDPANEDLLYATAAPEVWDGTSVVAEVPFSFKHILSKVIFKFTKSSDLNGLDLTITGISINPIAEATFKGAALNSATQYPIGCWTTTGTATTTVPFNELIINEDGGSQTTAARVVIPQALTEDYEVTFTVKYKDYNHDTGAIDENGAEKSITLNAPINKTTGEAWNPGYVYTYSATITAENLTLKPIEFTATTSEWTNADETGLVIQ